MKTKKTAFTLLELLAAIAIISLLIGSSLLYFSTVRQKTRDTKRLADIRSLSSALELYYRDEGRYPETLNFGQSLVGSSTSNTYLETIPQNPQPWADGDCPDNEYGYGTNASGTSYLIDFCLGGVVNDYGPGAVLAQPTGLANFICGTSTVFYDSGPWNSSGVLKNYGHYYRTVSIGDQCWLKDNLATKIKPDGSFLTNLADSAERDCVDLYSSRGTETDCLNGYALYTGLAALDGGSSGARGLCPAGFHLPSNNDWYELENYLKDEGQDCAIDRSAGTWECSTAGTKLKSGGSSEFEALLAGSRNSSTTFSGQQSLANFWSSDTETALLGRAVRASDALVGRIANEASGFSLSIRCVKD